MMPSTKVFAGQISTALHALRAQSTPHALGAVIERFLFLQLAHKTRRLGRQAGPVVGVLLPHSPVGRNGARDPNQP